MVQFFEQGKGVILFPRLGPSMNDRIVDRRLGKNVKNNVFPSSKTQCRSQWTPMISKSTTRR